MSVEDVLARVARFRQPDHDDGEPVVKVRDLVVRYDQQVVLNGIDMDVRRGEIVTILGGSGSGKSTLLRAILGLLTPVRGDARVLDVDLSSASPAERDAVYRNLGMVYQGGALFSSMTVFDNVALPLREHTDLDPEIIRIAVRMKLGVVGLAGFENRFPSELSGGQRKRVAFARAIAVDPPLLFADEPSAGLDPRIGRGLDDLIRRLCRAFNMAVVVVTHEMESVEVIADRIVMLGAQPGGAKVLFTGTYAEMQACPDPEVQAFLQRKALQEPRTEAVEILKQLVGED
ncbi:MAG: ABC transporter ATP-binding protein [Planctomycetota bacterium]